MVWPSGHGQVTNPGHPLVCHGQAVAHRMRQGATCFMRDLAVSPWISVGAEWPAPSAGIQTPACKMSCRTARAERTRFEVLSVPPAVARGFAVAAIAFPICHLVMEAKATTRGVSVKKRTWTCMHAVGEALHKRVFWEYPTTYQHKPHHHHQLHDRNQYLSSSCIFGSRVHQEDQGPSPVLSVVRGGWHHARRAHPDMVDWQPHR